MKADRADFENKYPICKNNSVIAVSYSNFMRIKSQQWRLINLVWLQINTNTQIFTKRGKEMFHDRDCINHSFNKLCISDYWQDLVKFRGRSWSDLTQKNLRRNVSEHDCQEAVLCIKTFNFLHSETWNTCSVVIKPCVLMRRPQRRELCSLQMVLSTTLWTSNKLLLPNPVNPISAGAFYTSFIHLINIKLQSFSPIT